MIECPIFGRLPFVTTPKPSGDKLLLQSASTWIKEALTAWSDEAYERVGALAPMAVEHLGKAMLWRQNPVLLAPLGENAENHLFTLATDPQLSDPRLRTIGLDAVLRRVVRLVDPFPVTDKRRRRLVEVRNGAVHVGTSETSRFVLLDALTVCYALLTRMSEDQESFFGSHHGTARTLLDQHHTEVSLKVTAKRTRARRRLTMLEDELGTDAFEASARSLESWAPEDLDPEYTSLSYLGIDRECPECGSRGRLYGRVEVDAEVDFDVEPMGAGAYETYPYVAGYTIYFYPGSFACNVCRLNLDGDELGAAGLPTAAFDIEPKSLGDDFNPEEWAQGYYGDDG